MPAKRKPISCHLPGAQIEEVTQRQKTGCSSRESQRRKSGSADCQEGASSPGLSDTMMGPPPALAEYSKEADKSFRFLLIIIKLLWKAMKFFPEVAEKQIYPMSWSGKQCDCFKQGVIISRARGWKSEAREITWGGNHWPKHRGFQSIRIAIFSNKSEIWVYM